MTRFSLQSSLSDRVALVTGAGSGIGAATAALFAEAGARLALLDHNPAGLEETAARLQLAPDRALTLPADASNPAAMREALVAINNRWARLDIVVVNAGINGVWAPLDQISPDEWDRTMAVNLKSAFLAIQTALPHLRHNGGSIVIISSINGSRVFSNSGATAYACSKAALVALAKMTALELARDRIRVNVICPGSVDTQIDSSTTARNLETVRQPVIFPRGEVPLAGGTPATARQVAELAWFLASDLSSHITGTEVFIDGAQSLLKG
jgi:NAD(P)-dependent dehydrogenase (short-subunit alcohol dehydrogenase family)